MDQCVNVPTKNGNEENLLILFAYVKGKFNVRTTAYVKKISIL